MANIYYPKDPEKYLFNMGVETLPRDDFKKLPISLEGSLDEIFRTLTNDANPMRSKENQAWLAANLPDHPHTSMGTGDLIENKDGLFMVYLGCWKKVRWA